MTSLGELSHASLSAREWRGGVPGVLVGGYSKLTNSPDAVASISPIKLRTPEFRALMESASADERNHLEEFDDIRAHIGTEALYLLQSEGALFKSNEIAEVFHFAKSVLMTAAALSKMQELRILRLERRVHELEEAATKP
jgi:hypothetical protein